MQVIQAIIEAGAYLSLRNWEGDTAYDIAVARGREEQIIQTLKIPDLLTEKKETIKKMEHSLHNVIRQRAQFLIERHGLQLPQIAIMWELESKGSVFF